MPSSGEFEAITAHLTECAQCRRELARLRNLRQLLTEVPVPPVPDRLADRIVERAKRLQPAETRPDAPAPPNGRVWRRLQRAMGASAALAAGLAIGVFLGNDVWHDDAHTQPLRTAETRSADPLSVTHLGRLMVDYDDSLTRTYLDLTSGRDG